jgi:hypothetical protein
LNGAELLLRADKEEFNVRNPFGLRLPMPPLAPVAPFQRTEPIAS